MEMSTYIANVIGVFSGQTDFALVLVVAIFFFFGYMSYLSFRHVSELTCKTW